MIRGKLVDWLTRWIAWLWRTRVYHPRNAIVKINLGSSLNVAPGWINLDGSLSALVAPLPTPLLKLAYRLSSIRKIFSEADYIAILSRHQFIFHNLVYGIPFPDQTVDLVFSSHLLEHLTRDQARQLVREAYRVLKPSGIIRLAVPDLARAFALYQRGDKRAALDYFFMDASSDLGRHQYMYDFELLSALLRENGFVEITQCAFQTGQMSDLNILDIRPDETLFVEAVKP